MIYTVFVIRYAWRKRDMTWQFGSFIINKYHFKIAKRKRQCGFRLFSTNHSFVNRIPTTTLKKEQNQRATHRRNERRRQLCWFHWTTTMLQSIVSFTGTKCNKIVTIQNIKSPLWCYHLHITNASKIVFCFLFGVGSLLSLFNSMSVSSLRRFAPVAMKSRTQIAKRPKSKIENYHQRDMLFCCHCNVTNFRTEIELFNNHRFLLFCPIKCSMNLVV